MSKPRDTSAYYTADKNEPVEEGLEVEDTLQTGGRRESNTYDPTGKGIMMGDGIDSDPEAVPKQDLDATEEPSNSCLARLKRWFGTIIPYGGLVSNVFSLGSVTLGGAIISMPSSFATSGIIMAVIYLVVCMLATVYTMALLAIVMEKTNLKTYEQTARGVLGRGWDYFVGGVYLVSCVGTAIGYVTTVSSLITPLLQKAPSTPTYLKTKSGNQLITSLIWLCGMLPVVLPKHVSSIRYVSAFGVCMVLYFVITVIVHSAGHGMKKGMRDDMAYFTTGNQAIYALSIFVFAFMCQGIAYPLHFEAPVAKRTVKRMTLAAFLAMGICTILYILCGVFGYFDFAGDVEDSVLENFDPINQPYMMVAYIGMLIKVCAAYAMNMVPPRNFIYHCLRWDIETLAYWKHILVVLCIATVSLIAGLFIPSVNLAFGLVGALCGGFIGFIFPALFWMYSGNWSLRTVGVLNWAATYFLLIAGVIAIVFGTIATIYSSFVDK